MPTLFGGCRCFGGHVSEGYGMTETSCLITCTQVGDNTTGHVGAPSPSCGKVFLKVLLNQLLLALMSINFTIIVTFCFLYRFDLSQNFRLLQNVVLGLIRFCCFMYQRLNLLTFRRWSTQTTTSLIREERFVLGAPSFSKATTKMKFKRTFRIFFLFALL